MGTIILLALGGIVAGLVTIALVTLDAKREQAARQRLRERAYVRPARFRGEVAE